MSHSDPTINPQSTIPNPQSLLSAAHCNQIFKKSITDYHLTDNIDAPFVSPFAPSSFEHLLYQKNWIDTVQWHLEDIIRATDINSTELVAIKRRIDASNQDRTDRVEEIDDVFMAAFAEIQPQPNARLNSETIGWLLDRMSILQLKVYHMAEQTARTDADAAHLQRCQAKLDILYIQETDMAQCYDELLEEIQNGTRRFKVYRQMKMYNDASLNPVLYKK
jgi:hypothetical protein